MLPSEYATQSIQIALDLDANSYYYYYVIFILVLARSYNSVQGNQDNSVKKIAI